MDSLVVRVRIKILRAGNRGFTLFELLLVVSLLLVFMTITVVGISRITEKYEKKEILRRVIQVINHARIMALTERKSVSLSFSEDGKTYSIDGNMSKNISLKRGLSIKGETLVFYPSGRNSGGSLNIVYEDGVSYIITLDPVTSRVTIFHE